MLNTQNSPISLYPDVLDRDTLAVAGRKVLGFHFQRMLENEPGTRLGEDIEALHDMRVATRRMRAAFRVFKPYFIAESINTHRTVLKTTGRNLGVVRDWDVLLEKTQIYVDSLKSERQSNLKFLMESWSRNRATARKDLIVYLDGESYHKFKIAFSEFVDTSQSDTLDLGLKDSLVYADAPPLIYSQLERVLAHEADLESPTVKQLHTLRIDFKRLRYTIEFFCSALGETVDFCIAELKLIQDHLGDLHDAGVALQRILPFSNTHDGNLVAEAAIEEFHQAKEAELNHLVATFPQSWARFRQPEFLQNLDAAIHILSHPI